VRAATQQPNPTQASVPVGEERRPTAEEAIVFERSVDILRDILGYY